MGPVVMGSPQSSAVKWVPTPNATLWDSVRLGWRAPRGPANPHLERTSMPAKINHCASGDAKVQCVNSTPSG